VEPFFSRSGLGLPVVAPGDQRRQRHQDRLGAAARLQAEQRAAVVDEVELDVAPAAIRLEGALALAEGMLPALLDDRRIGGQEMVADRPREIEGAVIGNVVEEDAADAARLVAMLEVEVLVAPLLEFRIVAADGLLAGGVEMASIFLEAV